MDSWYYDTCYTATSYIDSQYNNTLYGIIIIIIIINTVKCTQPVGNHIIKISEAEMKSSAAETA